MQCHVLNTERQTDEWTHGRTDGQIDRHTTKRQIDSNGVARTLKKLRTSKGDYWIKQWFSSSAVLFKMGTSLKEKNLLPKGANYFL